MFSFQFIIFEISKSNRIPMNIKKYSGFFDMFVKK